MLLTTQEAANRLGLTRGRIIQLIQDKTLPAIRDKFSRAYQIKEEDLEKMEWKSKKKN